ncbi:MAG: HD domain-containing phosphohydrolase [Sulfuricaulis sp.]
MPATVIIDDQTISRVILEKLMSALESGMQVQTFAEPEKALAYVQIHEPDLVLADYKMPYMNGVEFTRRFRQIYKDVPIMIITGVEDKRVLYDALNAGANDYLSKPIDHYECQARCRNLLTLRKLHLVVKGRAKWLEERVTIATNEISRREQETIMRLAKAGEYRDEETGNHVIRMAKYSYYIAKRLGLSDAEAHLIEIAAPMHDIGKIGIPDNILRKPGKLDPNELKVMKTHATIGHEILKDSPSAYLRMGAIIALGHHEKCDGTGYPGALAGDQIPLAARIVAVADVFDALSSNRPYKKAWPIDEAVQFIRSQRGKHFDPKCVDAFEHEIEVIVSIRQTLQDPPKE